MTRASSGSSGVRRTSRETTLADIATQYVFGQTNPAQDLSNIPTPDFDMFGCKS